VVFCARTGLELVLILHFQELEGFIVGGVHRVPRYHAYWRLRDGPMNVHYRKADEKGEERRTPTVCHAVFADTEAMVRR
jgi:hypothetical protein